MNKFVLLAAMILLTGAVQNLPPPPPGFTPKLTLANPSPNVSASITNLVQPDGSIFRAAVLEWDGVTNTCYRVDGSPDLAQWQTIGTTLSDASGPVTNTIIIIDASFDSALMRYYRLVPVDTNGVPLPK